MTILKTKNKEELNEILLKDNEGFIGISDNDSNGNELSPFDAILKLIHYYNWVGLTPNVEKVSDRVIAVSEWALPILFGKKFSSIKKLQKAIGFIKLIPLKYHKDNTYKLLKKGFAVRERVSDTTVRLIVTSVDVYARIIERQNSAIIVKTKDGFTISITNYNVVSNEKQLEIWKKYGKKKNISLYTYEYRVNDAIFSKWINEVKDTQLEEDSLVFFKNQKVYMFTDAEKANEYKILTKSKMYPPKIYTAIVLKSMEETDIQKLKTIVTSMQKIMDVSVIQNFLDNEDYEKETFDRMKETVLNMLKDNTDNDAEKVKNTKTEVENVSDNSIMTNKTDITN